MDLMGWLASAIQVRNDIKAQIENLQLLDRKWRELEEALRDATKTVRSKGLTKIGPGEPPPDRLGS